MNVLKRYLYFHRLEDHFISYGSRKDSVKEEYYKYISEKENIYIYIYYNTINSIFFLSFNQCVSVT